MGARDVLIFAPKKSTPHHNNNQLDSNDPHIYLAGWTQGRECLLGATLCVDICALQIKHERSPCWRDIVSPVSQCKQHQVGHSRPLQPLGRHDDPGRRWR